MRPEVPGIDAATLSIVGHNLVAICEEMAATLVRSAHSSIVREGKDCSTALLDPDGRVVAQSQSIPIQLGSIAIVSEHMFRTLSVDDMGPDEFLLTNDPYSQCQHLNDLVILSPVHYQGALVAWSGAIIHLIDIGGGAPSTQTNATDIFGEGLRIPSMRASLADLEPGGWLYVILSANVRAPDEVIGDIRAQLAATARGRDRFLALLDRYGEPIVRECAIAMQDYAESMVQHAIDALPNGRFRGSDIIESDGVGGGPYTIAADIVVEEGQLLIDLTGTDAAAPGPVNSPLASTMSAIYSFVANFMMSDSTFVNDGCYRPVHTVVPMGSLLNPAFPSPVLVRTNAANRLFSALKLAYAEMDPAHSVACGQDHPCQYSLSRLHEGRYSMITGTTFGAWGASSIADGENALSSHLSNGTNLPIEYEETISDWYRIEAYHLRTGSGGKGLYRGGMGLRRAYRILEDGGSFSAFSDRFSIQPWGLFGGEAGQTAAFTVIRNGESIELSPLVTSLPLLRGDLLIIDTAGGGGWGQPEPLGESQPNS